MQPSRAQIAHHPVHPMLVVFPVGLYITSFIFDLVYLAQGDPFWYRAAYWTMLVGLVGNLIAPLPGFIDYLKITPKTEARQIGTYHLTLGLTLAILYLINLLMRNGGAIPADQRPWGTIFLNLVGVLLLGVQGWLGGELVYRFGIGVDERKEAREERLRKVV